MTTLIPKFQQTGTGAVNRPISEKIGEIVSVKDFGAVGDGVTNNTSIFTTLEASNIDTYYLPAGTYNTTKTYLTKNYVGPGVIGLANNRKLSGQSEDEMEPRYLDAMHLSNAVAAYYARNIVFVGDSITYGYGVTENETYPYLINQLCNARAPLPNTAYVGNGIFDRMTLTGSTSWGTKGPIARSLIMQVGSTATFTTNSFDFLSLYFQQAVSAGTITITINGVTWGSVNTAGTATNDKVTTSGPSRTDKTSVVTLTCSVASVELTSIFLIRGVQGGEATFLNQSYLGYSTSTFTSPMLTSIGVTTPYNGGAYPLYVIALGTNDIYNSGVAISSAQFQTNLDTIATALSVYGMPVLTVPLRPVETTFSPILEPFDNYREAVYRVARKYGYKVVDLSQYDIASTGGYQSDGLHPNATGMQMVAAIYMQELNLYAQTSIYNSTANLILQGAYGFNTSYATPSYTVKSGGTVVLQGLITVNASAKNTTIATLPADVRPNRSRLFVVAGLNGGVGATGYVQINADGTIVMYDYSSVALTYLSLEGISYSISNA